MRVLLTESLRELIRDARTDPDAGRVDAAIAGMVDRWLASAIDMIDAAAAEGAVANARLAPALAHARNPGELQAATLASVRHIVDGVRAGVPDVDAACIEFASAIASTVRSAIAHAYLKASVAVDAQVGAPRGRPN
ncbi:MAG: hypothetical protein ACTHL8_23320 [Burkholderiaceae bacterium]